MLDFKPIAGLFLYISFTKFHAFSLLQTAFMVWKKVWKIGVGNLHWCGVGVEKWCGKARHPRKDNI